MPLENYTLRDRDALHLLHGYTNLSKHRTEGAKTITRGEGVRVFDDTGKEYIEAAAGMWSAAFGFGEREIIDAAIDQFHKLAYYHTLTSKSVESAINLAEKISSLVPIPDARVYFALSGSEANDFLIKFLWYYNNVLGRPGKKKVISRINGYHGATIAATSMTGIVKNHKMFDAPLDRFIHVSDMHYYGQALDGESEQGFAERLARELEDEILAQGPETVMAFLAEPITGGGGVVLPPADYYARVQEILRKYDILFLADEVICGFGRTGNMFGCETCGIKPDAMVLAKGLTSSHLPLAAIVVNDPIYQALEKGSDEVGSFAHGTTYSGYPVGAAVALKTIELIEERNILDHVRMVGPHLIARLEALRDHPLVGEVRAQGLLAAIQFVKDKKTKEGFSPTGSFAALVQSMAEEEGVITRAVPTGDAIAFSPPLIITKDEIDEAVDRFEKGLAKATETYGRTT